MPASAFTAPLLVLVACLAACDGDDPPVEAPVAAPVVAETPVASAASADAALPRVPTNSTERMAASHILVSYAGALNALPNVRRTREEAAKRAEEARTRILAGSGFADIAKAYSDDATGASGGTLGSFGPGTFVKPFEEAVRGLAVGQVSTLVETPFGFHVIQREAVAEVHCGHLLVSWAGAERAPKGVARSKEEAKARIEEALAKVSGGTDWKAVVESYSDGPAANDGGDLGWFGRGQFAEPLDAAAFDLDIGATSTILESPRGYHLLKRLE